MIKDLDYEHSTIEDLKRQSEEVVATKTCLKWNYDKTQFGETVITEVRQLIITLLHSMEIGLSPYYSIP